MSDLIRLRRLRLLVYCGALPEEQERRQPFDFDIDVHIDLTTPGQTDELTDTINYGELCELLEAMGRDERFVLLEAMAQRAADIVLGFDLATGVTVEARKVRPPVPQDLDTSGVRITRTKG